MNIVLRCIEGYSERLDEKEPIVEHNFFPYFEAGDVGRR